jgi:transposase InsO family protein
LAGRAAPTKINGVWVGDITDIPLATRTSSGRFGDLTLLMDLCSRRIVGWDYRISMSEDLVLGALRRAIQERQPGVGLIHHSDQGGQCASRRYRDGLRRSAMPQSMSATESCYDNAFMESSFGTVKTELELVEYANSSDAVRELSNDIRYFNGSRRHSSLGDVSPAAFESQLIAQK